MKSHGMAKEKCVSNTSNHGAEETKKRKNRTNIYDYSWLPFLSVGIENNVTSFACWFLLIDGFPDFIFLVLDESLNAIILRLGWSTEHLSIHLWVLFMMKGIANAWSFPFQFGNRKWWLIICFECATNFKLPWKS